MLIFNYPSNFILKLEGFKTIKMKKIFLTIISFLYLSFCIAQIDTYNYELNYELVHTNNNITLYKEQLLLLYGNKKSMFISQNTITLDSVKSTFIKNGDPLGFIDYKRKFNLKSYFTPIIIKNYKTNNYTFQDIELITNYKYTEQIPNFNWIISKNKIKTILNYNCKLATTNYKGRSYEAWFTEDIPIVDGPYKFTGLPGLIINIYDTKKQYNFMLTSIKIKKGEFPKIRTKDVIEIEKSQLKNIKEGAKQEILNIAIGDSKEKFKKAYKAKKDNYNPIELIDN